MNISGQIRKYIVYLTVPFFTRYNLLWILFHVSIITSMDKSQVIKILINSYTFSYLIFQNCKYLLPLPQSKLNAWILFWKIETVFYYYYGVKYQIYINNIKKMTLESKRGAIIYYNYIWSKRNCLAGLCLLLYIYKFLYISYIIYIRTFH